MFEVLEAAGTPELLDELCPYFGILWPAAWGLAAHMALVPENELRGKRVLEVGCGLAVPSLITAARGAQVTASDCHPHVPHLLQRNMDLNSITGIDFRLMHWRDLKTESDQPWDWIIGSDILYDRKQPALLADFLRSIASPSTRIVITDPGRSYLQDFVDAMRTVGFSEPLIAKSGEYGVQGAGDVFVLEFRLDLRSNPLRDNM